MGELRNMLILTIGLGTLDYLAFKGEKKCNDFAIGIELEGSNEQPFTNEQYLALQELTNLIMKSYPKITKERIVGHCDISPGRKIDPGQYFDWERYFASLK